MATSPNRLKFFSNPLTTEQQQNIDDFDTTISGASDFEDLMADSDFVDFIKTSYGLESDTATNEEISTYLTASDAGTVPAQWQQARSDLGFYNYTNTQDPLTTEQQQNITDFNTAINAATDIDDLLNDSDFMSTLKTAYGLTGDTATNTDIKSYLLSQDGTGVPTAWQQVRTDLNFFDNSTETSYFQSNIPTDANTLVNDATLLNVVKTAFGLASDTTNAATIETYLTATDESTVPAEWQEVRTTFGFYQTVPDSLTEVADNFIADMAEITTATEFVNNERTFEYAMAVHGPSSYTETDSEIIGYLNEASRDDVPTDFQPLYDFWQNFTDPTGTISSDELATTAEVYALRTYAPGDANKQSDILSQLTSDFVTAYFSSPTFQADFNAGNIRTYEMLGWYSDADNGSDVHSGWQTKSQIFQASAGTNGYTIPSFSGTHDPISNDKIAEIISNYNVNDESISAPNSATITSITDDYTSAVATFSKIVTPPDSATITSIKMHIKLPLQQSHHQIKPQSIQLNPIMKKLLEHIIQNLWLLRQLI